MFLTYRYHAEPEGHNLKDKISSLVRLGATLGMFKSAHELAFDPNRTTRTTAQYAQVFLKNMPYPMAAGFTYAVTKYILTNSRKVDDSLNTFLAGAATAPVIYGWCPPGFQHTPRLVVLLPIVLGSAALIAELGYTLGTMFQSNYRGSTIRGFGQPRTYSTYKLE